MSLGSHQRASDFPYANSFALPKYWPRTLICGKQENNLFKEEESGFGEQLGICIEGGMDETIAGGSGGIAQALVGHPLDTIKYELDLDLASKLVGRSPARWIIDRARSSISLAGWFK